MIDNGNVSWRGNRDFDGRGCQWPVTKYVRCPRDRDGVGPTSRTKRWHVAWTTSCRSGGGAPSSTKWQRDRDQSSTHMTVASVTSVTRRP